MRHVTTVNKTTGASLVSSGKQNKADKPEKGAKARATQLRIISAFERVLLREGVSGVGINAVVAEAGVGKGLIYHYFDGLEGLAQAWMETADLKPTPEDIAGGDLEEFRSLPSNERLARICTNYASMLRNRPAACHILSDDLRPGPALPQLLEDVRKRLGESHEALITQDPDFHNDDDMAKAFVLQAAANYLALRANSSPNFNGVELNTDQGWKMIADMLSRVAKLRG